MKSYDGVTWKEIADPHPTTDYAEMLYALVGVRFMVRWVAGKIHSADTDVLTPAQLTKFTDEAKARGLI